MVIRVLFLLLFSVTALAQKIDPSVVRSIVDRYIESESDALLIMQDGELILKLGDVHSRFETMSITKSCVNLAIGLLIDQGKIPSIDTPVHAFFPEWDVPHKREVTLRHLLSHTSGLEPFRSLEEGYLMPDHVRCALDSNVLYPPGSRFAYCQKGPNILSGLVEKLSGMCLDEFVAKHLFEPLGMTSIYWQRDFAGHSLGMYGLEASAEDLAKLGQLVLNGGRYGTEQLISRDWLNQSMKPSQPFNPACGLLWWLDREQRVSWPEELLEEYRSQGVEEEFIRILGKVSANGILLHDRNLINLFGSQKTYERFIDEMEDKGLRRFVLHMGEVRGARAEGYLGQYLLIIPKHRLVAVRLIKYGKVPEGRADYFKDFVYLVHELIQ